jgi:phytoene dehydrogenase-like protein
MKVLIAEQHFKPGGYCTSFKRKGFCLMPQLIPLAVTARTADNTVC